MGIKPEEWRPVVGHEGFYEVSDLGRVRSVDRTLPRAGGTMRIRGKILTPGVDKHGRCGVNLHRDGSVKHRRVHRLVLQAFVGPCPDGMEGCHNDGDATNNQIGNLRWDTSLSNSLDMARHGTNRNSLKTHCPKGHPYDAVYGEVDGGIHRTCRTCRNEATRRWDRKRRQN